MAPTDIALSANTVAENAALAAVIGALSGTDPTGQALTFSLTDSAGGRFDVSGSNLILVGGIDYEEATSHQVTVRATDPDANIYSESFTINVTDVAETPAEDPLPEPPTDGGIIHDGGFVNPPIAVDVSGAVKFSGKKAAGAVGKFVYDIGDAQAGRIYTMRYDPNFTQLANGGVTAGVFFGLKQGNDFWFTGLKGDGAAGLKAYEVGGANKWNQSSGFTTDDGGAAQNGTQAGPNWLQFEVSEDGTTYTLRTSADGESWDDEFVDQTALARDVDAYGSFGIGVFLESADAGNFSVLIDLWIDEAAALPPPLDGLSGVTGAYSMSRQLLTSYGGAFYTVNGSDQITAYKDQGGNTRDFTISGGAGNAEIVLGTAGPNSRACMNVDNAGGKHLAADWITTFIDAGSGYVICSAIIDAVSTTSGTSYQNHTIFTDQESYFGLFVRTESSQPRVRAYNWDGNDDFVQANISVATAYVFEWRHEGGTLYLRVNGGSWSSAASGNTQNLNTPLRLFRGSPTTQPFNGKFFELVIFDAVPSTLEQDALCADMMAHIGA